MRKTPCSVRAPFPKFSVEEVIERIRETANRFSEDLGLEGDTIQFLCESRYTVTSDTDVFIVLDESKSDEDDVYKTLMKNINFLGLSYTFYPKIITR
jgi:hypothetical protein